MQLTHLSIDCWQFPDLSALFQIDESNPIAFTWQLQMLSSFEIRNCTSGPQNKQLHDKETIDWLT